MARHYHGLDRCFDAREPRKQLGSIPLYLLFVLSRRTHWSKHKPCHTRINELLNTAGTIVGVSNGQLLLHQHVGWWLLALSKSPGSFSSGFTYILVHMDTQLHNVLEVLHITP